MSTATDLDRQQAEALDECLECGALGQWQGACPDCGHVGARPTIIREPDLGPWGSESSGTDFLRQRTPKPKGYVTRTDSFIHDETYRRDTAAYFAHDDELVRVLEVLKSQADKHQPLSQMEEQDLVPFLDRVELALNGYRKILEMIERDEAASLRDGRTDRKHHHRR